MPKKLAGFVLAVCITITPSFAQTTTELLQKGIYAQETEGNLDNAILIYRQIVNSAPSQRDLAAQAQFRLAQALLQKGDLTSAAQEFNKLANDYSDYRNLVSSLSAQNSKRAEGDRQAIEARFLYASPASTLAKMTFDESQPVRATGKVTQITFLNPMSAMIVDGPAGHIFALSTPADMMKQGFRAALKPGDQVEVSGVLAAGNQMIDGSVVARADLVTANGIIVFDRSKLVASAAQPNANADTRTAELKMLQGMISQLRERLNSTRTSDSDNSPEVVQIKTQITQTEAQIRALKMGVAGAGTSPSEPRQ